MLDTNTIGNLIRGHARIANRVGLTPATQICASVVTEGEVLFGLAKRGAGYKKAAAIKVLLKTIEVLDWTRATAAVYAELRADLQRRGRPLGSLDMMIAAHALESGAVLVTSDRALIAAPGLTCEDWLSP